MSVMLVLSVFVKQPWHIGCHSLPAAIPARAALAAWALRSCKVAQER